MALNKIMYYCDRKKCETCNPQCLYTTDIMHARFFDHVETGSVVDGDFEVHHKYQHWENRIPEDNLVDTFNTAIELALNYAADYHEVVWVVQNLSTLDRRGWCALFCSFLTCRDRIVSKSAYDLMCKFLDQPVESRKKHAAL